MSYHTRNLERATVDRVTERKFVGNMETVVAGGYCPQAEQAFCPDIIPNSQQKRDNKPDELTVDEVTESAVTELACAERW